MALANIIAGQFITRGKHASAIMLPSSVQSRLNICEAHQQVGLALNTVESPTCFANGSNTTYIESLFNKWLQNPFSVHKSWYAHFDNVMDKEDHRAADINAEQIISFFKRWSNEPESIDESWYWYFVSQTPTAPKSLNLPNKSVTATNVKVRQNNDEYMTSAAEELMLESSQRFSLLDSVKSKRISHLILPHTSITTDKRGSLKGFWSDRLSTAKTQAMPLNSFVPNTLSSMIATKKDDCVKDVEFKQKYMSESKEIFKGRSTMNIEKFQKQSIEDIRFHYFYNIKLN